MKFFDFIKQRFKFLFYFIKEVIKDFQRNNGFILTSGVVYSTLISLVPFLAVLLSFFSYWQGNENIQALFNSFFKQNLSDETYIEYINILNSFIKNAKSLGVVGLISFTLTSIFLLNRIWSTFNLIFKTNLVKKSTLKQYASYLSNLIIGTFLLSASISLSTFLKQIIKIFPENSLLFSIFLKITPIGIIFLLMILMIYTIPSTKVKWTSTLLGATCGTIGWQVISFVYQNFTSIFSKSSIIYGSFAYIFIFLIWIYALWVNIFIALEITYVHQYRTHRNGKDSNMTPSETVALSIDILKIIAENFKNKKGATSTIKIASTLSMPDIYINNMLTKLEKSDFIIPTDTFKTKYVPATSLENIKLFEICKTIYGDSFTESKGNEFSNKLLNSGINSFNEITLNDI